MHGEQQTSKRRASDLSGWRTSNRRRAAGSGKILPASAPAAAESHSCVSFSAM
jgi:hypothetical protein